MKWFYTLALMAVAAQYACAQLIPAGRRITWEGNAGVESGIPERATVAATLSAETFGNGTGDASPAIQSALDACPADQVVMLSEGTYRLGATVRTGSRTTLRGAGPDKTVLLADDIPVAVMIGMEYASPEAIDIVSGFTKGSARLVLADAGALSAGIYVRIDELNDPLLPVTNTGVGTCTWCSRDNGTRARAQVSRITAVSGDTVTISPALYFDFSGSNSPQVQAMGANTATGMYAEYSGIEDLTIRNNWRPDRVQGTDGREYGTMKDHTAADDTRPVTGPGWAAQWVMTGEDGAAVPQWEAGKSYRGDYSTARTPLRAVLTANCWARNLRIENCGARCIELYYNNFRFEIRGCFITKCINRWDSNNCYGTLIGQYTSGVLIEDNIYAFVADGPMLGWGASGNVMGYNYMHDAHRTNVQRTWFTGIGASHHGAHTAFNLWEGNECESVYFDQYWGSHSHNTLFRNRVLGKYMVDGIADDASINAVQTVATERHVRFQNYLGNVLGTEGYHDTYERNSADCPNGFGDKLIYRTGYASSGNCNGADSDPEVFATMLRHMNYDYVTNAVRHCGDEGEPPCQGSDGSSELPASLYLPGKPSWWGTQPWPAIGPDLSPRSSDIPAKARFQQATGTRPGRHPATAKTREDGPVRTVSLPTIHLLSFDLPRRSMVRVGIYNVSGALVCATAGRELGAGCHALELPFRHAGIFLVRLDAGEQRGAARTAVLR
jgi:hypothetical protein